MLGLFLGWGLACTDGVRWQGTLGDGPLMVHHRVVDLSDYVCEVPDTNDYVFTAMGSQSNADFELSIYHDRIYFVGHTTLQNKSFGTDEYTGSYSAIVAGGLELFWVYPYLSVAFDPGYDPTLLAGRTVCVEDDCEGPWYVDPNFATSMDGRYHILGSGTGGPGDDHFVPYELCVSTFTSSRFAGVLQLDFEGNAYYGDLYPPHVWLAFDMDVANFYTERCPDVSDWDGAPNCISDASYYSIDYEVPARAVWGPSADDTGADSGTLP
ncbi:hypothetical protein L6R53_15315 [Myxococcota bacterium]|nr:hypothetical protein [Myxococcota bacterium]